MSDPDATQPTPKPVGPHSPGPTPTGYQRTGGGGFKWQPPSPEKLAQLLPQYHIEALIGRGGMGAVYKGTQKALERPVAIKILPPEVDDEDASYTERFKNEAKIMARLEHPAIVPVYDFGETSEGQLYFVMGFINGTDIHQMIQSQGRLPPEHALAITAHVCDALGYAHQHGVIHRDIKPSNILINMEGQVKVADFGLAKAHDTSQSSGLTKTGLAMGTPDYVAPETLSIGMVPDGRADLYAVGVMLYQMLTGQVPRGAFDLPSKLTGCDPRFDSIVIKAMKYDREDRYPTATDLRRDLDIILTAPMVQSGGQSSAAIPKQSLPQKPTGKPVQPRSDAGTPARQESPPAGKSARTTPEPPAKSKTPLYIGLGVAAAIGIGAFVMFGGEGRRVRQNAESAPDRTLASAPTASAPKPAPAAAKPVPAAPSTPVSSVPPVPASSSDQFPPGKWVKVFTKFEELPGELRNRDSGWKWNDGWLQQTNPNKNKTFSVPGFSARNAAIRARIRYSADLDGFLFLSGMPGGPAGRLGHHRFRIGASGLHLEEWAGKNYTRVHQKDLPTGLQDGVMGEFAFLNGRVFARGHDILLPQARDDDLQEGKIGYYGSAEIRDIEVINLDGLPEAEALKILGVDEKGNDLRQKLAQSNPELKHAKTPPAPSAPKPASTPSAPQTSPTPDELKLSTTFPPGKWVKVFTKAEDLPEELRKPDSGVRFEDGWVRFPDDKPRRIYAAVGITNYGMRARIRRSDFMTKPMRVFVRGGLAPNVAGYEFVSAKGILSGGVRSEGEASAKTRWDLPVSLVRSPKVGDDYTVEWSCVGNKVVGRVDERNVRLFTDYTYPAGLGYFTGTADIRDIEVINLDGLPEAEALRILGVDDKGNDLRALAAQQEQQKAEMAKAVDALAAIPELKTLHEQLVKLQAERVTAPFEKDVAALNTSYLGGLDRKMTELKQKGDLDGVLALEAEKKIIAEKQLMPADEDDTTPATLKDLRKIYRDAHARLVSTRDANLKALTDPLAVRLKQLESTLTQANRIEHAKTVRDYREALANPPEVAKKEPAEASVPPGDLVGRKPGKLKTWGTYLNQPFTTSKADKFSDFVQVAIRDTHWLGLRANGETVSTESTYDGLKDVSSIKFETYFLLIMKKGVLSSANAQQETFEPSAWGGGRLRDASLTAGGVGVFVRDDGTVRLRDTQYRSGKAAISPNKASQMTKDIRDAVSAWAGGDTAFVLTAGGRLHGWLGPKWSQDKVADKEITEIDTSQLPGDIAQISGSHASGKTDLWLLSKTGTLTRHQFDSTTLQWTSNPSASPPPQGEVARISRMGNIAICHLKSGALWPLSGGEVGEHVRTLKAPTDVAALLNSFQDATLGKVTNSCALWIE
ncbi:MAG: serine/threonine protein kinase [Verrucomicrobiaceae bacterium]|nr:serine/threonine protein kinase [Verrucomicrobiaceae bacterium]